MTTSVLACTRNEQRGSHVRPASCGGRRSGAHAPDRTQDGFGWRAWKSFPWEATDGLHGRGLIGDPKSKAKSVTLTDEGAQLAKQGFMQMFGVEDADAR